MRTDAQLDGLPPHRATLALAPESLIFSGRTRRLEAIHHTLPLAEVVRVEAFDAEEPVNLQVWTADTSWRLWVTGPVVWRFAIEDAMRRLGRDVPVVPWVARSRDVARARDVASPARPRTPDAPAARGPRASGPHDAPVLRVGDLVPLHLTIEVPCGVRVGIRLLGEVEVVEPVATDMPQDAEEVRGDGRSGDGEARTLTDLPHLRVHR